MFRPLRISTLLLPCLALFFVQLSSCRLDGDEPYEIHPGIPQCEDSIFLDSFAVRLSAVHPLIGEGEVHTQVPAWNSIEYWSDGTQHLYTQSEWDTNYSAYMYMLEPATTYYAVSRSYNGICITTGDTLTFESGDLPLGMTPPSLALDALDFPRGMFILVNAIYSPGYVVALSEASKVAWYYYPGKVPLSLNWTADNTLILALPGNELREVDMLGNTVRSHTFAPGGEHGQVHHDLYKNAEGNLVALTQVDRTYDLSPRGGGTADVVRGDGIIIVDTSGNIIWDWVIFDHIDPLSDSLIATTNSDWSHANSVSPTPDGNYVIGFRNFSQVWKVNAVTGEVMWKLGTGGDFPMPANSTFIRQHHGYYPTDVGLNFLMMFDNGDPARGWSRGLGLSLNETNLTATIVLDARLHPSLFATKMGGAYVLRDGNVLMTLADISTFVITNKAGTVLWKADGGFLPYKSIPVYMLPPDPVP